MSVLKSKWAMALVAAAGLSLAVASSARADGWYVSGGYSSGYRPYNYYARPSTTCYSRPVYYAPTYCAPRPVVYYERPVVCYERPTYYVRPSYGSSYYGGGYYSGGGGYYSRGYDYGRGWSVGGSYYDNGYRGGNFYFNYRR